jgi:hypothetical protein
VEVKPAPPLGRLDAGTAFHLKGEMIRAVEAVNAAPGGHGRSSADRVAAAGRAWRWMQMRGGVSAQGRRIAQASRAVWRPNASKGVFEVVKRTLGRAEKGGGGR